MNKKQLIEAAKSMLEHVRSNPGDLKKFEAPVAEAKSEPVATPASAPKSPALRKTEPYFLSKAKVDAISRLFKKEPAEKCGDMKTMKAEYKPDRSEHPANGKLMNKEEKKAEGDRDPNGQGEMGKDEMKPAAKPPPLPGKAQAPKASGQPDGDSISVPKAVLHALYNHHAADEIQHFSDSGNPMNHVARHWVKLKQIIGE